MGGRFQRTIKGISKRSTTAHRTCTWVCQHGGKHHTAKPLKGFGSGVFEIVENYRGETYRVVYALQVGVPIYILHAFQKKSTKGIKTPKKELEAIRQRLKMAQEREHERKAI